MWPRHSIPRRSGAQPRRSADGLRATLTMYGDPALERIDFTEVVIHTGSGRIIESRTWTSDCDLDQATDEMLAFSVRHGVKELREVDAILVPEVCPDCGERTHRIVTDDDARRAHASTRRTH